MLLVDGSVHNTLPLNRVRRTPGDMLVAVNASAPYEQPFHDDSRLSRNYMRMAIRVSEVTVMNNTLMAETITPPTSALTCPQTASACSTSTKVRRLSHTDTGR